MPSTTYTAYPASMRSHHSTRSRRSMSRPDYSPSHYGGSHHGHGHPAAYAGSAYGHSSGGRQAYAYEPSAGHYRSGSQGSPQYYYPSTTLARPPSRSPTYAYSTNHHDTGRYSTGGQQPAYYVSSDATHGRSRSTRHAQQHNHRPTFGDRLKWLFGMGHKDYHASGKRSRDMADAGKSRATHDRYGRHIYTV